MDEGRHIDCTWQRVKYGGGTGSRRNIGFVLGLFGGFSGGGKKRRGPAKIWVQTVFALPDLNGEKESG